MSADERELDVVVFGATGFTGTLVAEYLFSKYGIGSSLRWGIAARDEKKLLALKASLGDRAASLPTIVADSFDQQQLAALASRTQVVITTVGPYAKFGSALVAACVSHGTHYCDLAGEVQWIRRMIDQHNEDAKQSGARIVHCCGFDSVPMDVGVRFLQREAKQRHGQYCTSIATFVKASKGGASGGTIASLVNVIKEGRADRSIARTLVDPYGLNPEGERDGPDRRDQQKALFDDVAGVWTAPFVMATINTKVVRRSNALLGHLYGREFRYREAIMTGTGFGGWLKATMITLFFAAAMFAVSYSLTRGLLERFVLTKPGDGPDKETRESGFYDLRQYGTLNDGSIIRGKIIGDRDPGYGSTSKMLAECAVCIAKDKLGSGGGVLTPSSAMGDALLDRLRLNAGLSFEILN